MRQWAACAALAASVLSIGVQADGEAPMGSATCGTAYEQAQVEKKAGHLLLARERLLGCSGAACPGWMRKECQNWLDEVERATPTVVLSIAVNGEERTQVHVELDGHPWLEEATGRALPLESGEHTLVLSVPGFAPVERRIVLSEGEKLKRIRVEFESNSGTAGPHPVSGQPGVVPGSPSGLGRPVPLGVWIVGGGAAASLLAGTILGVSAGNERDNLETTCSPTCGHDEVNQVRDRYVMMNVALGVGVAAAIGAVVWYVARPSGSTPLPSTGSAIVPGRAGQAVWRFDF